MTSQRTAPAETDGETTPDERDPLWRRILSGLFTLLIVAGAVYLWPAPLGGATRIIVVSGQSMEPTYDLGDLVLTRDASPSEVGDIVVFEVPEGETGEGLLVIHRILEIDDEGYFITQGDNRTTPDEWQLTEDEIVGHPLAHLPRGGTFFQFLQQLWVIVLIVGIVVVLVLWPDADEDEETDADDDGRDADDELVPVPAVAVFDVDADRTTELPSEFDFSFDDTGDLVAVAVPEDLSSLDFGDTDTDIDDDVMADAMAWLDEQLQRH